MDRDKYYVTVEIESRSSGPLCSQRIAKALADAGIKSKISEGRSVPPCRPGRSIPDPFKYETADPMPAPSGLIVRTIA